MQRYPAIAAKKIFLSIDEWAYFGGDFGRSPSLRQALAYGMVFHEMLRHTDSITFGAHTMGTSTLDFNQTASTLNGLGLLFKMYGNIFPGTVPVAVGGNAPQPEPKYPVGGDQPRQNSGSPTYPLDMFAALSPDHKFLTVAVVNATDSEQKFDLSATGVNLAGPSTQWLLTGATLDAANHVGQPAQVAIKEIPLGNAPGTISVAPISVNVYRFPVAPAQ